MKTKFRNILLALGCVAFAACSEEQIFDNVENNVEGGKSNYVVTLSLEDNPQTRATYQEVSGGLKFRWEVNDVVTLKVSDTESYTLTCKSVSDDGHDGNFVGSFNCSDETTTISGKLIYQHNPVGDDEHFFNAANDDFHYAIQTKSGDPRFLKYADRLESDGTTITLSKVDDSSASVAVSATGVTMSRKIAIFKVILSNFTYNIWGGSRIVIEGHNWDANQNNVMSASVFLGKQSDWFNGYTEVSSDDIYANDAYKNDKKGLTMVQLEKKSDAQPWCLSSTTDNTKTAYTGTMSAYNDEADKEKIIAYVPVPLYEYEKDIFWHNGSDGHRLRIHLVDGFSRDEYQWQLNRTAESLKIEANKMYTLDLSELTPYLFICPRQFNSDIKILDRNLGAASPEATGDYYKMGALTPTETSGTFGETTYDLVFKQDNTSKVAQYFDEDPDPVNITPGNYALTDNKKYILKKEYDAAYKKNITWRIPTMSDINSFVLSLKVETENSGNFMRYDVPLYLSPENGYATVTSIMSGHTLIFPCTGFYNNAGKQKVTSSSSNLGRSLYNSFFWVNGVMQTTSAGYFAFCSVELGTDLRTDAKSPSNRLPSYGYPIRPVISAKKNWVVMPGDIAKYKDTTPNDPTKPQNPEEEE